MTPSPPHDGQNGAIPRRRFLQASGLALAGGSAAALAACSDALSTDDHADAAILNTGLAISFEGVAAYAQTAHLFKGAAAPLVTQFHTQVQAHADGLVTVIPEFGGTPVKPKSTAQYAEQLGTAGVKDQSAAITFLIGFEKQLIAAYQALPPKLINTDLRGTFAQMITCEAEHVAVLAGLASGNDPTQQAPAAFFAKGSKD